MHGNLVAIFGISRQYTNRTVTQRMTDLEDFWVKLRQSKVKYSAKVYMLRAVAWPRGLHAVASAPVGDQVGCNSADRRSKLWGGRSLGLTLPFCLAWLSVPLTLSLLPLSGLSDLPGLMGPWILDCCLV